MDNCTRIWFAVWVGASAGFLLGFLVSIWVSKGKDKNVGRSG